MNIRLMIVGAYSSGAERDMGVLGAKRMASLSPLKPRISSNLDGRCRGSSKEAQTRPDRAAGATNESGNQIVIAKKTQATKVTKMWLEPQAWQLKLKRPDGHRPIMSTHIHSS